MIQDNTIIYKKELTKEEEEFIKNNYIIIKGCKKLCQNNYHYNTANLLDRETISKYNYYNYNLDELNIIILLPELNEEKAKEYIEMYETNFTIDDFVRKLEMSNFYMENNKLVLNNLRYLCENIISSNYWVSPKNCEINLTNTFNKRTFRFDENLNNNIIINIQPNNNLKDLEAKEIINKIIKINSPNNYDINEDDEEEVKPENSNTDKNKVLLEKELRKYYYYNESQSNTSNIPNNFRVLSEKNINELSDLCSDTSKTPNKLGVLSEKEEINKIFDNINIPELKNIFFNNLLISKNYSHLVINNQYILDIMTESINKNILLYKYLIGYCWNSYYIEETINYVRTKQSSRYVFDINTASKLPVFPYADMRDCPYLTLFIDNNEIKKENQYLSLPISKDKKYIGIATLDEFKTRFNIYTTGISNRNIFENINWNHFAISGSIIPACSQKRNILVDEKNDNSDDEIKYIKFFEKYYGNSDIDLMCNKLSIFEFINEVEELCLKIQENINNIYQDKTRLNKEIVKSMAIIIHEKYIEHHINEINKYINKQYTKDEIIKYIGNPEIKEYLYGLYCKIKLENNMKNRKKYNNPIYEDYYKLTNIDDMNISIIKYNIEKEKHNSLDSEYCLYMDDLNMKNKSGSDTSKTPNKLGVLSENYMMIKISENLKYKITHAKLRRSIETFRSKAKEFFGTVARFHLPCVRGYYNGTNVYLLPSCITALMTNINMDYKYFAGCRDPIDIIHKYRKRGFGTILNKNEIEKLKYYTNNLERMKGYYTNDIMGIKLPNHKLFNNQEVETEFIINNEDIINYYQKNYNINISDMKINMLKINIINEKGNINCLEKWIMNGF
jgi:hypothetical protein